MSNTNFGVASTLARLPADVIGCYLYGDLILVQLDRSQPEVRRFTGCGLRHPLLATKYLGFDYSYFFVDESDPKNPQTKYHQYSVDKSRFLGWHLLNNFNFAHEM